MNMKVSPQSLRREYNCLPDSRKLGVNHASKLYSLLRACEETLKAMYRSLAYQTKMREIVKAAGVKEKIIYAVLKKYIYFLDSHVCA